jgi:hypothetical protein
VNKRIKLFRASEGSVSGRIDYIGVANLPVAGVKLGNRVYYEMGNGAPSPYIVFAGDAEVVLDCVEIDNTFYVVRNVTFPNNDGPVADGEVCIKHDANITVVTRSSSSHIIEVIEEE